MDIDTSIIITNYNNGTYLDLCIKSIVDNTNMKDKEIVVINNGCTDNSDEICAKWTKKNKNIICLTSQEHLGLAIASNLAVSYANGKWLVITNEDGVFPKDWETTLLSKRKEGKLICPNLIEPGVHIPVAEGFTEKNFGTNPKEFKYKEFLKFEKSIREKKTTKATNGPQVISKKDYMMIGGCDPLFNGVSLVDTDFFIKMRLAGIEPIRTYECTCYHFSGKSGRLQDKNPNRDYFNQVESLNMKKFVAKWGFVPAAPQGLWTAPKLTLKGIDFSKLK